MKTVIRTDKSYLNTYELSSELQNLVKNIILEIDNKLIKNPVIYVYGKKCNQHRSVGFFSNNSIGYKYSGQIMKSQKLTNNLQNLLKCINLKFKSDFNGILINKYSKGTDYIGSPVPSKPSKIVQYLFCGIS